MKVLIEQFGLTLQGRQVYAGSRDVVHIDDKVSEGEAAMGGRVGWHEGTDDEAS